MEAWSEARLPFEPKGAMADFRRDLRSAVSCLHCDESQILHACYVSPVAEKCDVENVLVYNVGPSYLAGATRNGLRFERSFNSASILTPAGQAEHYYRYALVGEDGGLRHWWVSNTLARWRAECDPVTPSTKAAAVWHAIKTGDVEIAGNSSEPKNFGLRVALDVPASPQTSAAEIVKPLFDGIISSFQAHSSDRDLDETSQRIGLELGVDSETVAALLADQTNAVLGGTRLVWPWGKGVQWNPADDLCVVGELLLRSGEASSGWGISGELVEVSGPGARP